MRHRRGDRIQGRRAYGGVLVIPCQLNDAYRYWFLADTGTAVTMLSQRVAEEMGLDLTRPVRQERIASVHQVAQAPVLRLSSLQVGSRRVTDLEVLVLSYPRNSSSPMIAASPTTATSATATTRPFLKLVLSSLS